MPCTLICFFKSASFDCSSQYARYRGDSGRKQQRTKKMDVRAMASTAGCSLVEKSRKCCDQNIMYVIWLVCRNCMKYVSEIGWCGEALWAIYVLQKTWSTFSRVRWCITHSHIKPFCTQRNRIFGVLSLNFVMVGFFATNNERALCMCVERLTLVYSIWGEKESDSVQFISITFLSSTFEFFIWVQLRMKFVGNVVFDFNGSLHSTFMCVAILGEQWRQRWWW